MSEMTTGQIGKLSKGVSALIHGVLMIGLAAAMARPSMANLPSEPPRPPLMAAFIVEPPAAPTAVPDMLTFSDVFAEPSEPKGIPPTASTSAPAGFDRVEELVLSASPHGKVAPAGFDLGDAHSSVHGSEPGGDGQPGGGIGALGDRPVEVLTDPIPEYTREAHEAGVQGTVIVEATLTSAGTVHVMRVVSKPLGFGLEAAAIDAVRQVRFRPARRGGRPVDVTTTIKVHFKLA